ncbi:MAG: hypothetical protein EBY21_15055, partial [Alphaproteobacteria bacterium]|nr:hypothetical protein [Alphaproteobacteria bacterium]
MKAELLRRAERASALGDVEARMSNAAKDFEAAKVSFNLLTQEVEIAISTENAATEKLRAEKERGVEIETLKANAQEMVRHEKALNDSAEMATELLKTEAKVQELIKADADAGVYIHSLIGQELDKREAVKVTRLEQAKRQEISERMMQTYLALHTAQIFERAKLRHSKAAENYTKCTNERDESKAQAVAAEADFNEAELALSNVQALHLAAKLTPGAPCLVCGAIDHPAPATGTIEDAGRNQAFLDAKAIWHKADEACTKAERAFEKAETLMRERQEELSRLEVPVDQASILQHQYDADQQLLESLRPVLDVAPLEDEADALKKSISAAQAEREIQRKNLGVAQAELAGKTARHDQLLSDVPKVFRDAAVLQAEHKRLNEEIEQRQGALKNAEESESAAREAKVAALTRAEQAQGSLTVLLERHVDAEQAFAKRLEEAGFTQEAYVGLKSAITQIDTMRQSLEMYRRELHTAKTQAKSTQDAIADTVRPDFAILKEALERAEE